MCLRIYLEQTHNASQTNYSSSKINTAIAARSTVAFSLQNMMRVYFRQLLEQRFSNAKAASIFFFWKLNVS